MRILIKLCLVCCTLPLLLAADVYRWVDADGVVNFTQHRPEGIPSERVSSVGGRPVETRAGDASASSDRASAPTGNPDPASRDTRLPDLNEEQQQLLEELQANEQKRQQDLARAREANCERARQVLDNLTTNNRIRVRGDDGQERVLPEEERQLRISEAQQGIAVNCAGNDQG